MQIPINTAAFLNFRSSSPMYSSMAEDIDLRLDGITGADARTALLTLLFRETDRAQRTKSPLSLILFALDPVAKIGAEVSTTLPGEILKRSIYLLRTYDLAGRMEESDFFVLLPGCGHSGAVLLAERLRSGVFTRPFMFAAETLRLSACFGITSSTGRSPAVVLREAAQALRDARASGPGSIVFFSPPRSRNL